MQIALNSIPASSDTVKSERQQKMQHWRSTKIYVKLSINAKNRLLNGTVSRDFLLVAWAVDVMVRERDPIRNLTSADGGIYTCEIETDLDTPLTLSHTLQILGKKIFTRNVIKVLFEHFYNAENVGNWLLFFVQVE